MKHQVFFKAFVRAYIGQTPKEICLDQSSASEIVKREKARAASRDSNQGFYWSAKKSA